QGNAPGFVARVNRHGVPVPSIGLGALVTGVCVLINYLAPGRVVEVLISLVTATLVLIWAVIICTHFKFRAALRRDGVGPRFAAPFAPWSNLLCLGFIGLVIAVLYVAPATRASAYAIPVWIAAVYVAFRVREQLRGRTVPAS
ncbi:MAG: amino acid permease, partial [Betaproteobacteria bacterium]|nr:amino acid permease [Betaproteobacteria bacterium]